MLFGCQRPNAYRKLSQHGESKSREFTAGLAATSLRFGVGGFQVADQPLKRFLIRVVVLPVAEVGDEILANLAGGVFAGVGVEALPVAQGFKGREPDGEQDSALIEHLALAVPWRFRSSPTRSPCCAAKDQQQL